MARAHEERTQLSQAVRWIGTVGAAALAMALACVVRWPGLSARVGFSIAFAVVATQILFVAWCTPAGARRLQLTALCGSALSLFLLAGAAPGALTGAWLTAALLAGGSVIGAAVGTRIERPGHLLAVAVIGGMADLWSVLDTRGPTAQLVAQALREPERMPLFALPWPLWGTDTVQPLIGVGDVVFVALYAACFARHGLAVWRAIAGMGAGFLLGLGLLLRLEQAIPLLPLLGAGAVLADRRARQLERRELYAVLGVTAVLVGFLVLRVRG